MDSNMHEATTLGMQSTGSSDEQIAYLHQQELLNEEEVVESDGMAMNGVLTQAESSRAQLNKIKLPNRTHSDEVIEQDTTAAISRKRRRQTSMQLQHASTSNNQAPCEKPTSFQLFRIAGSVEEYILEQTMVETKDVQRYHLSVYDAGDGTWKVKKVKAPMEMPALSVVVKDSDKVLFVKDCEFPFKKRLQGWTFTTNKRPTGAPDTFYYHMGRKSGKKFRSLVEVCHYIVYSCCGSKMVPDQSAHNISKVSSVGPLSISGSTFSPGVGIFFEMLDLSTYGGTLEEALRTGFTNLGSLSYLPYDVEEFSHVWLR